MQSLAHNDRSRYMWDGIVCLADKPVEPEECMCKAGECVRDISIPALVCVLLHASENASVREISLSLSLSPSLPLFAMGTVEGEGSSLIAYSQHRRH